MAKKKPKKPSFSEYLSDFFCMLRGASLINKVVFESGEANELESSLVVWIAAPSRRALLLFLCQNDMLRLLSDIDDDCEQLGEVTEKDFERLHADPIDLIVDEDGQLVSIRREEYPEAKSAIDIRKVWEGQIAEADRFLTSRTIEDMIC